MLIEQPPIAGKVSLSCTGQEPIHRSAHKIYSAKFAPVSVLHRYITRMAGCEERLIGVRQGLDAQQLQP